MRNDIFANIPAEKWKDWHWHLANKIQTVEDLKKLVTIDTKEEEGIARCLATFRMAITPHYFSLIDLNDPHDPIRAQSVPSLQETNFAAEDLEDP